MKTLYISSAPFFDVDLSLVKSLSKKVELIYLLDLPKHNLKTTALNIDKQIKTTGILKAENYPELRPFLDNLPSNFYIINRPVSKLISIENGKLISIIRSFIKEQKPDIIHFNDFANLSILSSLFNKHKKIMTIHDPIPHIGNDVFLNKLKRKINFSLIKNYILLNRNQLNMFKERYNISGQNIFLSSLSIFDYYKEQYNYKGEINKKQFIFFGRISPYKGIDILLKAFKEVLKIFPDTRMIIAGKGDFDFKEYDLTNVKVFNRFLESGELFNLISESGFVVCPYIEATQSGVIMTAYSLKKPVIATKVGGLPEMVDHLQTGLLCEPKDIESLTNSILTFLKNPALLNEFSKNIEESYRNNGDKSWDKITNNLVSIYKKL